MTWDPVVDLLAAKDIHEGLRDEFTRVIYLSVQFQFYDASQGIARFDPEELLQSVYDGRRRWQWSFSTNTAVGFFLPSLISAVYDNLSDAVAGVIAMPRDLSLILWLCVQLA